ncbi:MAG TPA: hypothetical protein VJG32_15215 [Anaerolineae bacterium]|nr:hypothetical protein [Anaerolineae bacterium]
MRGSKRFRAGSAQRVERKLYRDRDFGGGVDDVPHSTRLGAYRSLVVNRDAGIIFSRRTAPPYSDEDALMHPDMLLPLAGLRDLLAAE